MTSPLQEPTFLILAALAEQPMHGYGVIQEVMALSDGRVTLRPGTLYGALDRLVEQGLAEADREEIVDGRLRRYYRLTDAGASLLEAEAQRLASNAEAAVARLRRRPKPRPDSPMADASAILARRYRRLLVAYPADYRAQRRRGSGPPPIRTCPTSGGSPRFCSPPASLAPRWYGWYGDLMAAFGPASAGGRPAGQGLCGDLGLCGWDDRLPRARGVGPGGLRRGAAAHWPTATRAGRGWCALVLAGGLATAAVPRWPRLRVAGAAARAGMVAAWGVASYDNGWTAAGWTNYGHTAALVATIVWLRDAAVCAVWGRYFCSCSPGAPSSRWPGVRHGVPSSSGH